MALRFAGTSVTYSELDRRSAVIAAALKQRGFGRNSLAGLALDRSAELVIWAWACWRAGGAFLPLDPAYPADRLRYMVDDAKPSLVIVDGAAPAYAPGAIDRAQLLATAPAAEIASAPPHPHDLAYLIYTSGSTGRPKGVEVPFRGLTNLARAQAVIFDIAPDSRVLQFASACFDAFVAEVLSAFLTGASLHVPTRDERSPGPGLREMCAREAITVATFPPSLLAILDPRDFPTLRTIVSAGEACSAAVVRRWAKGRRFVNAYGPTEATVCATAGVVTIDEIAGDGVPSIGDTLPGVDALVVDDQLRPVGDGEVGELLVAGVGLARGYRDQPDLTAAAFVPHPSAPDQRVYRTGDLVRRDAGRLYFVGRTDDQIKLRGYRIEPAELEHALRVLPEIADAAVVAYTSPRIGPQLVAHVVLREGAQLDPASVRERLRASVAPFMIPDALSPIAELPRGPNGKVDYRALPAPRPFRPAHLLAPAPATSPLEAYVVGLFEHLLGVPEVGVDDNFFDLGGHSLAAVTLLARIGQEQGRAFTLSVLTEHPTPRALAARMSSEAKAEAPVCVVPLRRSSSDRSPLFIVHAVGGNAGCYIDLASALGNERTIYGLQNPALVDGQIEPTTIEDMAAGYASAIRTVQPRGPYALAGWSIGGTIALEIARVLVEAGEQVAPVILLDAWCPNLLGDKRPSPDDAHVTFMFIKNNLGRAAGIEIPITPAETIKLSPDERLALARSWAVRLGTLPEDVPLTYLRRLVDVFGQTLRAFAMHRPRPYPGDVVHIQASKPVPGHPRPPTLGWEGILASERVISLAETSHFVFVYPPAVERIASLVRDALECYESS